MWLCVKQIEMNLNNMFSCACEQESHVTYTEKTMIKRFVSNSCSFQCKSVTQRQPGKLFGVLNLLLFRKIRFTLTIFIVQSRVLILQEKVLAWKVTFYLAIYLHTTFPSTGKGFLTGSIQDSLNLGAS